LKTIKAVGITATTLLMLTTSIAPAQANEHTPPKLVALGQDNILVSEDAKTQALLEKQYLEVLRLSENSKRVISAVNKLRKHVNRTAYVFSGNTPSGWDCSGLTMWFYKQLDIELEHRATKQATEGTKVSEPKLGDIVAFHYENSDKAYHVGIYIGDGQMIHSPAPGKRTAIDNIKRFGGSYSDISYVRYIDTI
jgi:cell wall-associated NlpC family hydrolase